MGKGTGRKRRERAALLNEQKIKKRSVIVESESLTEQEKDVIPLNNGDHMEDDELVNENMFSDSDIEGDAQPIPMTDVNKVAEQVAQLVGDVEQASKTCDAASSNDTAVVYIGHLPYGFFEEQMKSFFSQFGEVTRLRISRNPKTLKSRHYGFIEFATRDTAQIVAETMNQYMMFGRTLVVNVVEPQKVHADMFKGCERMRFCNSHHSLVRRQEARIRGRKPRTLEGHEERIQRLLQREEETRKKIAEAGIDYDFPGYRALLSTRVSSAA